MLFAPTGLRNQISELEEARDAAQAQTAAAVSAEATALRRLERDIHDGPQQRLVHTVVNLKLASRMLESDPAQAQGMVAEALDNAQQARTELRELAHGIIPSVLTHGGLRAGVGSLASRMPMPVLADVADDRYPPELEATVYFVIAEALTNVAKHAQAQEARVTVQSTNGVLRAEVSDNGVGGAFGGGEHAAARRVELTQAHAALLGLDPAQPGQVGDHGRGDRGHDHVADGHEVTRALAVQQLAGRVRMEVVERERAQPRGQQPHPQAAPARDDQHAEDVEDAG
jgi:hypothetical protein